jgi:hypothetical protein
LALKKQQLKKEPSENKFKLVRKGARNCDEGLRLTGPSCRPRVAIAGDFGDRTWSILKQEPMRETVDFVPTLTRVLAATSALSSPNCRLDCSGTASYFQPLLDHTTDAEPKKRMRNKIHVESDVDNCLNVNDASSKPIFWPGPASIQTKFRF